MSKKPALERGTYRSIPVVLTKGPDYQAFTPAAKLVLFHLKLELGQSGLDHCHAAVLSDETGYDLPTVEAALEELQRAGWIRVERRLFWVIDQLRFDPHCVATNPLHRKGIEKHLSGLPRLAIVEDFRSHYSAWFQGDGDTEPEPLPEYIPDTHSNTIPEVFEYHSKQGVGNRDEGKESFTDLCGEPHDEQVIPLSRAPSARAKKYPEPNTAASFADFKNAYPKREGGYNWKQAEKCFQSIIKKGEATAEDLIAAAKSYRAEQQRMGNVGTRLVLMPSSFLGTTGRFFEHIGGGGGDDIPDDAIAPEAAIVWNNLI